jgi:GSCFA family
MSCLNSPDWSTTPMPDPGTHQVQGLLRQTLHRILSVRRPGVPMPLCCEETDNEVSPQVSLSKVCDKLGLQAALARYQTMLEADPQSYIGLYGAALALVRLIDLNPREGYLQPALKAREYFKKAIEISDSDNDLLFEYARVCARIGPEDEAKKFLEELLRREPSHARAHEMLSDVLAEMADTTEEAFDHLNKATLGSGEIRQARHAEVSEVRSLTDAGQRITKFARFPSDDLLNTNFDKAVRTTVLGDLISIPQFISPTTNFFALGSCFARNLALVLRARRYPAQFLEFGEHINSTFANRARCWTGPWTKPSRRLSSGSGSSSAKSSARHSIRLSPRVIFTVGVAPCFFDTSTGRFVMPRSSALTVRALAHRYTFRTTTVAENAENLRYIIATVRSIKPTVKIVLTLSPVPLNSTFEMASAVQADCLSKSTLRVAINEVMQDKIDSVFYWPAFEIVRWLSGHIGKFYGKEDGAVTHVNEEIVDYATFEEDTGCGIVYDSSLFRVCCR